MDAKALFERMTDQAAEAPVVRDVIAAYAMRLAGIAEKLTKEELDLMVEIGVIIDRQTTYHLVPVLRADQIDAWLSRSDAATPRAVLAQNETTGRPV